MPLPEVMREVDLYDLESTGVLTLPEFELYFKSAVSAPGGPINAKYRYMYVHGYPRGNHGRNWVIYVRLMRR